MAPQPVPPPQPLPLNDNYGLGGRGGPNDYGGLQQPSQMSRVSSTYGHPMGLHQMSSAPQPVPPPNQGLDGPMGGTLGSSLSSLVGGMFNNSYGGGGMGRDDHMLRGHM